MLLIEQNADDGAVDRQLRLHHGDRQDGDGRAAEKLLDDEDVKEFYLGLHSEARRAEVVPRRQALQAAQEVAVVSGNACRSAGRAALGAEGRD